MLLLLHLVVYVMHIFTVLVGVYGNDCIYLLASDESDCDCVVACIAVHFPSYRIFLVFFSLINTIPYIHEMNTKTHVI